MGGLGGGVAGGPAPPPPPPQPAVTTSSSTHTKRATALIETQWSNAFDIPDAIVRFLMSTRGGRPRFLELNPNALVFIGPEQTGRSRLPHTPLFRRINAPHAQPILWPQARSARWHPPGHSDGRRHLSARSCTSRRTSARLGPVSKDHRTRRSLPAVPDSGSALCCWETGDRVSPTL